MFDEAWNGDRDIATTDPGLLLRYRSAQLDCGGVVSLDFRADPILQGSHDFAPRGVILRVCGEDQNHIERKADRVALNLNVTFLHDVEKSNLNLSGQVWKLIDGKNAAVGAGKQSIVN